MRVIIVEDEPPPPEPAAPAPTPAPAPAPAAAPAPATQPPKTFAPPAEAEAPAPAAAPEPPRPEKYDFLCVLYNLSNLTELLVQGGNNGWELVSVGNIDRDGMLCFQRPRP